MSSLSTLILALQAIAWCGLAVNPALALDSSNGSVQNKDDSTKQSKTKVFGVGLSKTGTTSMAVAMEELGYTTTHTDRALAHFMHHKHEKLDLTGFYDKVDSVWDIPTAAYYRELHDAYPSAKFVLTVRDSDKWYQSFQQYLNDFLYFKWGCEVPERVQRLHEFVYGSRLPNESWISSYEKHNREVVSYFAKHAPDQLLVIDITEGNAWPELCDFLEINEGPCADSEDVPDFPHVNNAVDNTADKQCPRAVFDELRDKNVADGENFAYVTLLCDPQEEDQGEYIRMLLVLGENIRQFDKTHDLVTMVHGSIGDDQKKLLKDEGFKVFNIQDFASDVSDPPTRSMDERATSCYRAKIRALQLTQYDKIMFLDNDIMFKQDPQYLFRKSGFTAYQGFESPLNAGLFVVEPSQKSFTDIRDIASSNSFHPQGGWLESGPFPHWRLEGQSSDWSFWGSHVDQGLLYYYYDKVVQQATFYPPDSEESLYTHFTGKNKPFLHDPKNTKTIRSRSRDALILWHKLWALVEARMGRRNQSYTNGGRPNLRGNALLVSTEKSHQRIERLLVHNDPYGERGRKLQVKIGTNQSIESAQQRIERVLQEEDPYGEPGRKLQVKIGTAQSIKSAQQRIDRVLQEEDPYADNGRKLQHKTFSIEKAQQRIDRVLQGEDPYN